MKGSEQLRPRKGASVQEDPDECTWLCFRCRQAVGGPVGKGAFGSNSLSSAHKVDSEADGNGKKVGNH